MSVSAEHGQGAQYALLAFRDGDQAALGGQAHHLAVGALVGQPAPVRRRVLLLAATAGAPA